MMLGLLMGCGSPPWTRPHAYAPAKLELRLEVTHIVSRVSEPRRVISFSGNVGQDKYCAGLGPRPSATVAGRPLNITPGRLADKDSLSVFQTYQCVEPHLSGELDLNSVRNGLLEIQGKGVHIVAEHPMMASRPLLEEGGPVSARLGQRFSLRWLAPGVVPSQLTVEISLDNQDWQSRVLPQVSLVGNELQLILPSDGSTGRGVLQVSGRLDGAFTRCEGIQGCTADISFLDTRAFTVLR